MPHPCLTCGACCAFFRVAFHWSETEPELGGRVPFDLTEPLRTHERAMRGTSQAQPRCVALDADIGRYSHCTIHERRPRIRAFYCKGDAAGPILTGPAAPPEDRCYIPGTPTSRRV